VKRDPLEQFRRMLDNRTWLLGTDDWLIGNDGEILRFYPSGNPLEERLYCPLFFQFPDPVIDLDKTMGKFPDPRKYT
jgi:hypothetical protein